jgi:hypothetical protein
MRGISPEVCVIPAGLGSVWIKSAWMIYRKDEPFRGREGALEKFRGVKYFAPGMMTVIGKDHRKVAVIV